MSEIILDPRQGSGDLLPLLQPGCELGQLRSGDVMGTGHGPTRPITWGIEIKKLSDALQCQTDGRLAATQLPAMHEDYDYVFLCVEEDMRVCPETGLLQKRMRRPGKHGKWAEFWVDVYYGARQRVQAMYFLEWLISLHVAGGARLLLSGSREMTAAWTKAVMRFFDKEWRDHKSLQVFDTSHPPRFVIPSRAVKIINQMADGIGWEKAEALAEHFGTAEAVAGASVTQLKAVHGIGDVLAGAIFAGNRKLHQRIEKRGTSFTDFKQPRKQGNGGTSGKVNQSSSNAARTTSSGAPAGRNHGARKVSGKAAAVHRDRKRR